MTPRIVVAVASAAALLLGLTAWFFVDRRASPAIEDGTRAAGDLPVPAVAELSAPGTAEAPSISRTVALSAAGDAAPSSDFASNVRTIEHGPSLSGTVTSRAKAGPLAATITARLEGDTDDFLATTSVEIATDERGVYSAHMLASGDWLVSCSARGHQNADRRVKIEAGKEAHADFVLAPETQRSDLVVHLRAMDGRPLLASLDEPEKDVARVLRPVFLSSCPARDQVLSSANTVLPIRASGVKAPLTDEWFEVKLDATSSGCCCLVLGDRVLDAVPFDGSMHDVVLVASREDLLRATCSLRFFVLDEVSDVPLQARVSILPVTGTMQVLLADGNGMVRAQNLIEGDLRLEVHATKHGPVIRTLSIARGAELDLGVIHLKPNVSLSGRVSMPAGIEPIRSVVATRIADDKPAVENDQKYTAVGRDARFTFENLAPGMYVVGWRSGFVPDLSSVQSGSTKGWTIVDARAGSVDGAEIVITEEMWKSVSGTTSPRAH